MHTKHLFDSPNFIKSVLVRIRIFCQNTPSTSVTGNHLKATLKCWGKKDICLDAELWTFRLWAVSCDKTAHFKSGAFL